MKCSVGSNRSVAEAPARSKPRLLCAKPSLLWTWPSSALARALPCSCSQPAVKMMGGWPEREAGTGDCWKGAGSRMEAESETCGMMQDTNHRLPRSLSPSPDLLHLS